MKLNLKSRISKALAAGAILFTVSTALMPASASAASTTLAQNNGGVLIACTSSRTRYGAYVRVTLYAGSYYSSASVNSNSLNASPRTGASKTVYVSSNSYLSGSVSFRGGSGGQFSAYVPYIQSCN